MFHKAIKLELKEGTALEVTFQTGEVKAYDMAELFAKYPQLTALRDRELFLRGKLMGPYGIVWNEELDIEAETIYHDGSIVRVEAVPVGLRVANALASARAKRGLTQSQLAALTGIDQSDISKIERGAANPSLNTLDRLATALDMELKIGIA